MCRVNPALSANENQKNRVLSSSRPGLQTFPVGFLEPWHPQSWCIVVNQPSCCPGAWAPPLHPACCEPRRGPWPVVEDPPVNASLHAPYRVPFPVGNRI